MLHTSTSTRITATVYSLPIIGPTSTLPGAPDIPITLVGCCVMLRIAVGGTVAHERGKRQNVLWSI
jgi:hypothetical protein